MYAVSQKWQKQLPESFTSKLENYEANTAKANDQFEQISNGAKRDFENTPISFIHLYRLLTEFTEPNAFARRKLKITQARFTSRLQVIDERALPEMVHNIALAVQKIEASRSSITFIRQYIPDFIKLTVAQS